MPSAWWRFKVQYLIRRPPARDAGTKTTMETASFRVLPEPDCIVRASFLVRFSDSKKRRTIKIMGSNKLSVVRDGDTALMEKWLDARGFIIKRSSDEQESEGVLASA